jgi:molybdenum cofactor sulfurtransferase
MTVADINFPHGHSASRMTLSTSSCRRSQTQQLLLVVSLMSLVICCMILPQIQCTDTDTLSTIGVELDGHSDSTHEAEYDEQFLKRKRAFQSKYPEYGYNGVIDELVQEQMTRLNGAVYLDYTGSGQYQERQIRRALHDLTTNLYGNSHSQSPSSILTEKSINVARDEILRFFGTDSSQYTVVFTAGATGALKLVGESFPWSEKSVYWYLRQNHNSVLGVREYTIEHGGQYHSLSEDQVNGIFEYASEIKQQPVVPVDIAADLDGASAVPHNCPADEMNKAHDELVYNLFSFPAEDNFAGVKYPLEWITLAQQGKLGSGGADVWETTRKCTSENEVVDRLNEHPFASKYFDRALCDSRKWKVMLDAAAFVPTQRLNLTMYPANFVSLSFYKMFGYPTGLGALLVRNDDADILQRRYFGGGTVVLATCEKHFAKFKGRPDSRFEDGTVSFLNIAALRHGFDMLNERGIDAISRHVHALTLYTYEKMVALQHSNGNPVVRIFGKHNSENSFKTQGPVITFDVLNFDGSAVGYNHVQRASAQANIHIRTGCHCNPGACDDYLEIEEDEVVELASAKVSCGDEKDMKEGRSLGAVRASFGYLSRFEDADRLVNFIRDTYVDRLPSSIFHH